MEFQNWIYYYFVPVAVAIYICGRKISRNKGVLIMHVFVGVSIILLSTTGVRLDWNPQLISWLALAASTLVAVYLLNFLGLVYVVSSVIQEICLLLAGIIAVSSMGLILGAAITSLMYTLAHFSRGIYWSGWHWKLPLLFGWGILSIILYFFFHQPLLNIAIHAVVGAVLIQKRLLWIWDRPNKPPR